MTGFDELLQAARAASDPQRLADAIPYGRLIGVEVTWRDGALGFRLPFAQGNIGNPMMPALHGGLVGAFMEHAAILHLLWTQEALRVPKVIDFSIDYLRPGQASVLMARCDVRRQGRRVANVGVSAWQADEREGERVIAHARMHFLLSAGDGGTES